MLGIDAVVRERLEFDRTELQGVEMIEAFASLVPAVQRSEESRRGGSGSCKYCRVGENGTVYWWFELGVVVSGRSC